MNRFVAALTFLALVGCSQGDTPARKTASDTAAPQQGAGAVPAFGLASAASVAGTSYEARIRQQRAFAHLPDRGELLSYPDRGGRKGARVQGAYTWHRVEVSEEHALRAIATGRLRVLTPSGQALDIRYDHHIEHPSGDLSWVGHVEGEPGAQTVITFGADAVYGSIGQPGKRSLRLTTRNGAGWLVETDTAKLVGIASAGANPRKPDALALPKARAGAPGAQPVGPQAAPAAAAAASGTTIDLLIGYTSGFASGLGSTSAVTTRLNQMVAAGNEALANSQVNARIRLVHAMQVNYTDNSTNESALEELTGYDSSSNDYTTPNAAFNALRAARETYGADLVSLVRDFRDPEQDGCGIAWLIGGGQSGVLQGDDYFGYSVVSDGYDENGGNTYFCREETLIHELAHNMGSQHDRESAEGDDGELDADEYGAFPYSFGLKTSASAGNFYTVMAYGDEGQTDYRVFSNPRITFCGGRACGTTQYEDNARSLGSITPLVSSFRRSATDLTQRNDLDGDGRSDLLFRYSQNVDSNYSFWIMNGPMKVRSWRETVGAGNSAVATGDFNGDGRADIVWKNGANQLYIWFGTGSGFARGNYAGTLGAGWSAVASGDVNGDGFSDLIFLYNRAVPNNLSYWLMDGTRRIGTGHETVGAGNTLSATGDFNADGLLDVVWTNSSREVFMWLGTGTGAFARGYKVDTLLAGWSIRGAGDANGDGRDDLVLGYHAAVPNNISIWRMNGATRTGITRYTLGTGNLISSIADFNGDGFADIVFTNSKLQLFMWIGSSSGFRTGNYVDTIGAGWSVISPGK